MNRAERRRQQKAAEKTCLNAPYNFSNFSLEQISKATGARVESLKLYLMQREDEMRKELHKEISEELISESQEKLWKAEDYIAVANVLISLFAIKKTWGFTKSNQRFLENLNSAKEHIEEVGIEKAYQEAKETMGIKIEFDSININKEFGFGESED
nr:MAG TPA: hypothetical protein [Caudoviricetes sp.]